MMSRKMTKNAKMEIKKERKDNGNEGEDRRARR